MVNELFTAECANTDVANVADRNTFDKIEDRLSSQSSDELNVGKVSQLGRALNANLQTI